MRALLPALALSAAVAAAAAPAGDPGIAFSAMAARPAVPVALRPHREVVVQRQGIWVLPPDWRWMSDLAQIRWMLANRFATPRCRVVIQRRMSARQAESVLTGEPPPSGRALVKRILDIPESKSLPAREFLVAFDAPDTLQPPTVCVDDPLDALRARLGELERGSEACARAAAEAEAGIKPFSSGLVAAAAESYRRCGDLVGMERVLRAAVELYQQRGAGNPERPQALYELGTLLVSQGRPSEGEVHVRRAVDLALAGGVQGTDLAIAIEELAELYELLGQKDDATRRWVQSIALHEKAARAAGREPARELRALAKRQRARSQPRSAELFGRRAEQLVQLRRAAR